MKSQNFSKTLTKDILFPNDSIRKFFEDNYYLKSAQQVGNVNIDIYHLENIFTDQTYYLALKAVPLPERKVLYLTYIENARLNDICRRLKLSKIEVILIRKKVINHFRNNIRILQKTIDWGLIKMGNFNVESTKKLDDQVIIDYLNKVTDHFVTLSVSDVSRDLHIGINQAYDLFEQANFPTIKIGRKTITLTSYLLLKMSKKGGV